MQSETINRPTQKIQNLNTVIRQIKSCFIDTRSKNAPQDLVKRKTTCEIHQNTKNFLAYDERSPRLECKYAFKVYFDNKQIIHLEFFPLSFRIPTITIMKSVQQELTHLNPYYSPHEKKTKNN